MWDQSQKSFLTWSASSTSQILQPVAGLKVGKVFLRLDRTHLLSMKICGNESVYGSLQEISGLSRLLHGPPSCSRWTLTLLPWCIWYPGLGQAEEEAKPGSPHSFRSLLFHSVPFLGSRSSRVCLLALCPLSTYSLVFYNNVESAPPRPGVGKPNSTPLTKAFIWAYSLLQTLCRN